MFSLMSFNINKKNIEEKHGEHFIKIYIPKGNLKNDNKYYVLDPFPPRHHWPKIFYRRCRFHNMKLKIKEKNLIYSVTQMGVPYSNRLSQAQFLTYQLHIYRQPRKIEGIFFIEGFLKIFSIRERGIKMWKLCFRGVFHIEPVVSISPIFLRCQQIWSK